MIQAIIALVSLVIALLSIIQDLSPSAPNSWLCLHGGCRFDQIYAGLDAASSSAEDIRTLVLTDPSNPLAWCTYAEVLSFRGETDQAAAAIDHAISLGPGMTPVWMRAANFDFAHGRRDRGFMDSARILSQASGFDEILFSYLTGSGTPISQLLGKAVPAKARSAQAWLVWLHTHGTDSDLETTWSWMNKEGLTDQKSAVELTRTLWERKAYRTAQEVWVEWLGERRDDYLRPQRIANRRFASAPTASPFDWRFDAVPSVEFERKNGLELRFSGKANLEFAHLHQFTAVSPGRYRFSAEIEAEGITTDERPFWRILGVGGLNQLAIETPRIEGNVPRSWVSVEFNVPEGTDALDIQLRRKPSMRFDNKIAGILRIYEVSLLPLPADERRRVGRGSHRPRNRRR